MEFEVQKTYENNSMAGSEFTFNLYEASIDTSNNTIWTMGNLIESISNGAAIADDDSGNSQDTIGFTKISYSTTDTGTYYYIISEAEGTDAFVTYDSTGYGVEIVVDVVESSSGNVTTYTTTITTTYYVLTAVTDSNGNVTGYTAEEIDTSGLSGSYVFSFTNTYIAGAELPETSGPGTLPSRLAGLLLMSVSGYLIYDALRRRRVYAV